MATCAQCHKPLSGVEVAAHRKLVNRGASSFLCLPCLCARFRISEEDVLLRLRLAQQQGCLLLHGMDLSDEAIGRSGGTPPARTTEKESFPAPQDREAP